MQLNLTILVKLNPDSVLSGNHSNQEVLYKLSFINLENFETVTLVLTASDIFDCKNPTLKHVWNIKIILKDICKKFVFLIIKKKEDKYQCLK